MPKSKLGTFFEDLVRDYASNNQDEDELLTWMLLLHTHEFHLREALFQDAPGVRVVAAATQRSAAEAVARAWGGPDDRERSSYPYWYRMYQLKTPYERMKDVPKQELEKVRRLKLRLESHPFVKSVVPQT